MWWELQPFQGQGAIAWPSRALGRTEVPGVGGRWESPPAFVTVREEAPPRTAADLPGFVLPM